MVHFPSRATCGQQDGRKTWIVSKSVVSRPATSSDLDTVISLNAVVQNLHARLEPKHFVANAEPEQVRSFFATLLQSATNHILIAEVDAVPVVWRSRIQTFARSESHKEPQRFERWQSQSR
jgi:hypothetical protein